MRAAVWSDGAPDEPLILEDKPTPHLIYLATGGAIATRRGATVGQMPGGALFGEVTCLDGTPATASVVLSEPSRLMRIDAETLRRLAKRPEIRSALEHSFRGDMRAKLVAANAK